MKIYITPYDIIERALWDDYVRYCLSDNTSDDDIKRIITENKEFEISEHDALMIKLLKCIETNDLKHRFNQYILDLLASRSTEIEKKIVNDVEISEDDEETTNKKKYFYMIKKKLIIEGIKKFKNKFPPEWKPDLVYQNALNILNEYMTYLSNEVETLEIYNYTDKHGTYEMLYCNHIKKALNLYN